VLGKLFGGKSNRGVPGKKTLSKWLAGSDVIVVDRWLQSWRAALLEMLDAVPLENYAMPADLENGGRESIKKKVIRLVLGPEAPGSSTLPLNSTQLTSAKLIYDEIRLCAQGEWHITCVAVSLANACMAWYTDNFDYVVKIATHTLEEMPPHAAEAFRVRAFGYISLGQYRMAADDLRRALVLEPGLDGVKEPLASIESWL
jgi:hypothetical protein